MKKKKTLIVLLVLLLVGILAFTAFACKKEKPEPDHKDDIEEKPKPTDKTDLGGAINGIVASLDNLIGTVGTIEDEASLSATIYVNAETTGTDDDIDLGLEITLAASMDTNTANNNWASLIVKDTVKNKNVVGLYAEATNEGEYLYIGQPLTASSFKWSKLSQAENAGLIRDKLVPGIIDLIADIDTAKLETGIVNDLVGGYTGLIGSLSALFNTNGNADYTTDGGYELGINVNALGKVLPTLMEFIGDGLNDYMDLIDIATDILLGVKLSEAGDVDFSTLVVPEIVLKVATAGDNVFTGLDISYKKALEKGNIAVSFGLKDVAFAAESKAAEKPFTGNPDELTLKLSLDVTLPTNTKFAATNAVLDVYVKPAVVLGFYDKEGEAKNGYFSIDFTGLDGYATLTYGDKTYTVAEYVAAGDNPGFYIDLSAVTGLTTADTDNNITTKFYIPFNAQNMYDNWIDDVAERDIFAKAYIAGEGAALGGLAAYTIDDWKNANPKYTDDDGKVTEEDADYEKRAQEGWKAEAESRANAFAQQQQAGGFMLNLDTKEWYSPAATPAPLNAGNDIDNIIWSIGSLIADTGTANIVAQIGKLVGIVINDGGLLDTLTALFEDTSIFDITEVEGKEYGVVVVLSKLMDNLLGRNGLIGGMLQEADGDYKPTEFELYTGNGNEKAAYTLAELMASDKVYDNIHTLINSIIYDSKLDNAIADWKNSNPKDESYADDAAYETAAYNGAVEAVGTYQEFLATSAAVTADELKSLLNMVGFAVNEDDFYAGLSLGAKVTMGDGFRAEIAVASGENVISIGLGFDIIASSDFEDLGVIGDGSVEDFQTTGGTDQITQKPNADKLYDALKTIANAVLPAGFQIS